MLKFADHLLGVRNKRCKVPSRLVPHGDAGRFKSVQLGREGVADRPHDLVERNVDRLGHDREVLKLVERGVAGDVMKVGEELQVQEPCGVPRGVLSVILQ